MAASVSRPSHASHLCQFRRGDGFPKRAQHPVHVKAEGNDDKVAALVGALWDGQDESKAKQLLDAGNIDLAGRVNGKTALHFAALDGYTSVVSEMVEEHVQHRLSVALFELGGEVEGTSGRSLGGTGSIQEMPGDILRNLAKC